MMELDSQVFFGRDDEVDPDDLSKVEVNNFTVAVDRILLDLFDWDGSAMGAVVGRKQPSRGPQLHHKR
jgi:hypothetical protein